MTQGSNAHTSSATPDPTKAYRNFIDVLRQHEEKPGAKVILALDTFSGMKAVLGLLRRVDESKINGEPLTYDALTSPERQAIRQCGYVEHFDRMRRRGLMVSGAVAVASTAAIAVTRATGIPTKEHVQKLRNALHVTPEGASTGLVIGGGVGLAATAIAGGGFLYMLKNEKQQIVTNAVNDLDDLLDHLYAQQQSPAR